MENTQQAVLPAPGEFLLPDERVLRVHLAGGDFRLGVADDRWRLVALKRPYLWLAVKAADRPGAPDEYIFRFDFTNYPQDAMTGCPWDLETNAAAPPARWPGGEGRVGLAFNPGWRQDALYLPCDRIARIGHEAWLTENPEYVWTPDKEITFYLDIIYDYLHSGQYTGLRRT